MAPYRDVLTDFCKRSKQRNTADFIRPKSRVPAAVDPELSTSASDMMDYDASSVLIF
jgi:hypothetical protein